MLTLAQCLIVFDHVLLAILFLIALFCTISAVSASFYSSQRAINNTSRTVNSLQEEEEEDEGVIERTDTCYSVRNGTSILIESDLKDVV